MVQRILIAMVATTLLVRTFHCLETTAMLCAAAVDAQDAGGSPWSNPDETDPNESGCICKGALVGVPNLLAAVNEGAETLAACCELPSTDRLTAGWEAGSLPPFELALLEPPPISGRALRALHCALVI